MNKYEQALNSLVYVRRDENNKPIDIVVNDFITVKGKSTFQMRVEFIETLQELVKRATPRPINLRKGVHLQTNEVVILDKQCCPECNEMLYYDSCYDFCPHCGQALDWSDEK